MELFYSSSPNVYKVMIALEELELPYELRLVDLSLGEQKDPARLAGAVHGKVPVLRDDAPLDGGAPITVMESGAILQYLAEKTGRLLPPGPRGRLQAMQWLFWQMGGLGPIGGQAWHFRSFAPRLEPTTDFRYPRNRYDKMLAALWDVMEARLAQVDYLAGEYSIADIACFPWIRYLAPDDPVRHAKLLAWRDRIEARPAVARWLQRNEAFNTPYGRNERGGLAYPFDGLARHVLVH
jgi:GST-like protein